MQAAAFLAVIVAALIFLGNGRLNLPGNILALCFGASLPEAPSVEDMVRSSEIPSPEARVSTILRAFCSKATGTAVLSKLSPPRLPHRDGLSDLEAPQTATDIFSARSMVYIRKHFVNARFAARCSQLIQLDMSDLANQDLKELDKAFALSINTSNFFHLYSILLRRSCPLSALKISGCIIKSSQK